MQNFQSIYFVIFMHQMELPVNKQIVDPTMTTPINSRVVKNSGYASFAAGINCLLETVLLLGI